MVASGVAKFLGVSMGTSKTTERAYFHISLFDPENGRTLRIRCEENVYNDGMLIPFGQDVNVDISIGEYQGNPINRVVKITE